MQLSLIALNNSAQQVSAVIGYLHPNGNATANYRFNVVGTAYTYGGNVFNTYCSPIIYGKSNVVTPTHTPTSTSTSTPTPTVTPTTTKILYPTT